MKKIVSLLLFAAICAALFTIPAGAIPAPVDVLDQDIAFMNTLNYQSPEIYYQPSDTAEPDVWLHEPMIDAYFVLDGINVFYYNFPSDGDYVFYIADSESRTEAMIYSDQNLLVRCYEGYKDKNGYDQTGRFVLATATPKDNAVFFINDIGFSEPVIHYRSSGSADTPSAWKSAPMTPDYSKSFNEYGDPCWRYDFPREVFCFYISDGDRRTEDVWFAGTMNVWVDSYDESRNQYEVSAQAEFVTYDPSFFTVRNGHGRYYQRFTEYLTSVGGQVDSTIYYDEVIHQDAQGNRDWVLIYANCGVPAWSMDYGTVGNRAFLMGARSPFKYNLGLYDVGEDTFYDLAVMKDYNRYDGLQKTIDEFGVGKLIGDMDRDNQLTIVDVTIMQRCLAKISAYPSDDIAVIDGYSPLYYRYTVHDDYHVVGDPIAYYSDFDRDGEREITDATALQRYLADLPYPIG